MGEKLFWIMQKNIFSWLPVRWLCLLHFSRSFLLMSTEWNFKIEELLGHTVAVISLILLSTWDPLNNFSFSHPLVRTKMTKTCLQKENIYQSLTHKSPLFLSPLQPFHTVENHLRHIIWAEMHMDIWIYVWDIMRER